MPPHARNYLVAGLLILVGVGSLSCDRVERMVAETQTPTLPQQTTFRIDDEGIFYVTYGASGKKYPANHLREIPVAERGVVGVHITGTSPDSLVGKQVYVANLLGADPGTRIEARLESFEHFQGHSRAASQAGHRAVSVLSKTRRLAGIDQPDGTFERRVPPPKQEPNAPEAASDKPEPSPQETSSDEIVIRSMDDLNARTGRPGGGVLIRPGPDGQRPTDRPPDQSASDPDQPDSPAYRPVTLYGAPWCPACQKAKKWLTRQDVSFTYRDIDQSHGAKQEMVRFCRKKGVKPGSIPTLRIEVDGREDRVMQGWSPEMFQRVATR